MPSNMVSNSEIKCRRLEFDLPSRKLCPLVSSGVHPSNQIKVVYVFKRAEVCALKRNAKVYKHVFDPKMTAIRTHLDEWTETNPSLGPSFSKMTECDHLLRL